MKSGSQDDRKNGRRVPGTAAGHGGAVQDLDLSILD